jgi:anti-anti-sigma factor
VRITNVDIGDEWAIIYLSDDANSGVDDELALTISNLLNDGCLKITLNFGHVAVLDSAGLGEIVRASAAVRRHGGQVRFEEANHVLRDVFDLFKPDGWPELNEYLFKDPFDRRGVVWKAGIATGVVILLIILMRIIWASG